MTHEYRVEGRHPALRCEWVWVTPTVGDERQARMDLAGLRKLTWRDTGYEEFRLMRRPVVAWEEVPDA